MTSIWKQPVSVETITASHANTTVAHLGIESLEIGDDFMRACAPVDSRTRQMTGALHGGVSVLLAETLGSCGAAYALPPGHQAVGLSIDTNYLLGVDEGWMTGITRPLSICPTTHVWQIELTNDKGQLTSVSRITMAILAQESKAAS
jgi:1,4-dihydroxy-2-naphthoyl-CoA hydrolase